MLSIPLLSLLALSTLFTSFVSGILGMAGGMILMGVLLAVLPVPQAMMLHGTTQLASNGSRAFFLRAHIDWRVVRGCVAGSLVAVAGFALAGIVLDKATAFIVLGCTPFVTLLMPERLTLDVQRRGHAFGCGLLCTGLAFTSGVSGPLLDTFFQRSAMSRHAVVATKAFVQSASHVLRIAYFGTLVAGGGVPVALIAAMVALTFLGTRLSRSVLERLTDGSFRLWTRRTITVVGAAYLLIGLRELMK